MGIGDELMMSGEARRLAAGTAKRFRMLNKRGEPYWHFAFDANPNIVKPGQPFDGELGFLNRHRPYIADETREKRTFREYVPSPSPVRLGPQAQTFAAMARGAVVFHPGIKRGASPNKAWPLERWKALVALGGHRWVQIGEPGVPRIRGAEQVMTPGFWDAVGLLAGAKAAVLHEGALHHAAAAVGTRAVVIYGGYISPRVTGYAGQRALFVETSEHPLGCGYRVPCAHCAEAMRAIGPATVLRALKELLEGEHENRHPVPVAGAAAAIP